MLRRQPLLLRPTTRPRPVSDLVVALLAVLLLLLAVVWGSACVVEQIRRGRGGTPTVEAAPVANPGGGPVTLERDGRIPTVPPRIDLMLLLDASSSYTEELDTLRRTAPDLVRRLDRAADVRVGLATFIDHPTKAAPDDHVFAVAAPLGAGRDEIARTVENLRAGDGTDVPEASLEALTLVLDDPVLEWRPDARQVLVLGTDAPPHLPGPRGFAGRNLTDITAELRARAISVVLVSPEEEIRTSGTLAEIVAATGGSSHPVAADGADLNEAIVAGLGRIPVEVEPTADCPGFDVSFDPPVLDANGPVVIDIAPAGAGRGRHRCRLDLGEAQVDLDLEGPTAR